MRSPPARLYIPLRLSYLRNPTAAGQAGMCVIDSVGDGEKEEEKRNECGRDGRVAVVVDIGATRPAHYY